MINVRFFFGILSVVGFENSCFILAETACGKSNTDWLAMGDPEIIVCKPVQN